MSKQRLYLKVRFQQTEENAFQNAVSLMHLSLKMQHKENYVKVGECKVGIGLQVNKIMCSFYGGYSFEGSDKEAFQRYIILDARNNGQGLLKAKIKFFLKKFYARGLTTHHDLTSKKSIIRSLYEVSFC